MNLANISLDRRQKFRKAPDKFAFLQLERDDGGNVLDVSEGGLRFETFSPVYQEGPVHFWFSFNLRDRIEAWGELVWTNAEKKCGGLRFLHLSEEARSRIREWMAEPPQRQVADGASASRAFDDRTPGKLDAVAAFVSKAKPRPSTFLAGGEDSAALSALPPIFQNTAEQALGLVPFQTYLASKRKNLFLGILLGICISATIAMAAFKYSNYRRQIQVEENLAAEARTASLRSKVQAPAPATSPTSNQASDNIFSTGNPKKGTSSTHASQTLTSSGSAAPTPTSSQPRSNENASQKQQPRTPAQLWAAVHAGNSKAAVDLAELYIQGEGVPRNCMQARVLLLVASEKRNANAIKRLQELDKTGCPGE
jgi:PilZ domain